MVSANTRSVKTDFSRALSAHPGQFSFFGAVRRMEQLAPDKPRIGYLTSDDPIVRFAQVPHLHFPPSEIFGFSVSGSHSGTLQLYFFGMFGPNGALPLSLTEYVYERSHHDYDLAAQRFADMFHDRLAALFYRAGTRAQVAVSYDREQDDPLSYAASALAGTPPLPGKEYSPLPKSASVAYARELVGCGKPGALRRLLEHFFRVPVKLRQFLPGYLPIHDRELCRLGSRAGVCTLGHSALLGDRQLSISDRVGVEIGPISYARFRRLAPGSRGYERLKTWLHMMSPAPRCWVLTFHVLSSDIERPALNGGQALGCDTVLPSDHAPTTPCTVSCLLT